MSCTAETTDLLRQHQLRVTRQRIAVLTALRHSSEHSSADDVYRRAVSEAPQLNPSTVYRTLTQLRDLGLVSQTDLGSGERTYAWRSGDPHHHLICVQCGAVTLLPHEFLVTLETSLRTSFQFHADLDHWAVYGHCQRCSDSPPEPLTRIDDRENLV